MGLVWQVTPEQAFVPMTEAYIAAIRRGARAIAERRAPEIEQWMKSNHLWQNRTGMAEEELHTAVEQLTISMLAIRLEHGVDYGIFLELAHGGRFAIIAPALDHWGPVVWNDVQALMR